MISELTKLRLKGQVEDYLELDTEDEPEEQDELLEAIQALTEKIGEMSVTVDLTPLTTSIERLVKAQETAKPKGKWKHTVTYNDNGDVADIVSVWSGK